MRSIRVATDADGGTDAQTLVLIFRRIRIVARFLNVFDRYQPAQLKRVVHDENFLDAVTMQRLTAARRLRTRPLSP